MSIIKQMREGVEYNGATLLMSSASGNKAIKGGIVSIALFGLFILTIFNSSCKKDNNADEQNYEQVKLVSDVAVSGAARVDVNLINPWGIAIGPTGAIWIASNATGVSTIYDGNGTQLLSPVVLPAGVPTGVVYNKTPDFVIPVTGETSKFIYVSEAGTISAWSSGAVAIMVADRSALNAVYKGVAIAKDGDNNFLYAANFKGNNIDVYDKSFNFVTTKLFDDPTIPEGYAPFNVYEHDNKLFVTYAKQQSPENVEDVSGAGNGYVNIFTPDGVLVKRFASGGTLNSPWAVVDAPSGFGLGSDKILIGNFGDGHVNVFSSDGSYQGQLMDNGTAITIDGLWALSFPEDGTVANDKNHLFFTAGPNAESHGLFGYLKLR